MAPLVVDPEALAGAGEAVAAVGDELETAMEALSSSLGGGAPSGLDAAGLAFGMAYQKSAQALLEAGASLVDASHNVGFGVGMSATNYSQANSASTIGGGAAPLTAPEKPNDFTTPSSPSALGGGVPPPFLWSVLQTFIPDAWPDGDPSRLRASAEAWQSFSSAVGAVTVGLSGPAGVIASQQIPEGSAMMSAMSELSRSLSDVATEAGNLSTQTREFADDVQSTQDAIRDLCDRVSPSGFFDGIKAMFSGDALDEIKEIADDVKQVLENFGRQADGRISLMESLITALDDAVVSMQQSARREFTHYLGDDVGGALASAFEFHSNVSEGIIKGGLETVVGVQQLDPSRFTSDPDGAGAAWSGVLDTLKYATPTGVAMDPAGALDHGKDMLGGIVHAEDWRADRPGLGLGGVLFEASSAATGVGAAKTGLRGASAAADVGDAGTAVRAAAGTADATAPIAGRASEIAINLDEFTTLADDIPSGAASGTHGPALPRALAEPDIPRVPEASRLPESAMPQGLPHSTPDSAGPHPADLSSLPKSEGGGSPAEVPPQAVPEIGAPRAAEPGPPQVPPASSSSQPHPSVPQDPTTSSDSSRVSDSGASDGNGHHPASAEPHLRGEGVPDPQRWDESVLSEEMRDEIQAMDKGTRPDPSEYLPQEFIEHHLERFDDGASRFMTAEALGDYGIGHRDGTTVVFPTRELENLMEVTGGDRRALEQALGLPDGYFETDGVVRVDVAEPKNFDLRIPSGNEAGANDQWIPGGFLPTGMPEAVIDGADVPAGDLTVTDLDGR